MEERVRIKLIWLLALGLNIAGASHAGSTAGDQEIAPMLAGLAAADTVAAAGTTAHAEADAADSDTGWQFAVTPYLWASGIKGEFELVETVEIDTSFIDILGDLKFGAFLAAEARNGRFVIIGDMIYLSVGSDAECRRFCRCRSRYEELHRHSGRRISHRRPGSALPRPLAGGRLTSLDVEIGLSGPLQSIERENSKSSVAPVVGARFRAPLGGHWGVAVYGDLAGMA